MSKHLHRVVKIGLVGTHEVGKTTLAYALTAALKEQGYKVDVLHESAEMSRYVGFEHFVPSIFRHRWIVANQMAGESRKAMYRDHVICDRTVLDEIAYARVESRIRPDQLPGEEVAQLETEVELYVTHAPYDLLVYVPIREEFCSSILRGHDEEFRRSVDVELRAFLAEIDCPVHELEGLDVRARVDEVLHPIDLRSRLVLQAVDANGLDERRGLHATG